MTTGLTTQGERFIRMMLDPAELVPFSHMEVVGTSTCAKRHVIELNASWRGDIDLNWVDWPYAESIRLLVDAEYGVLLLLELYLDDVMFIRWAVEAIAFDAIMPNRLFEGV